MVMGERKKGRKEAEPAVGKDVEVKETVAQAAETKKTKEGAIKALET